ncbi:MFS transporter [Trinickia violacea]|uniref:MFS transporter n=1 Tax=Trinickia violacea TaxID=2571746 RepID=A0A4P8IIR6_9BURK|nr:MFS transporter [Trinickia violacea]QCP48608.1 MFS transporter [Trinickia violacea]
MATTLETAQSAALPRRKSPRNVVVAASLGNALEMFDFTVFSFFAVLIGKQFFPVDNGGIVSLLLSLATFGIGFVMRPLGSICIGNYADRRGRKPALMLTISLMALGTALIGFAPTYAQIGLAAPVLIVAGRLLQGFSAGGEIGASTAFLMESGSQDRRGLMVSFQMVSQGAAALFGALAGTLLSNLLSPESLESWGWRVPFIFGLLIAPVGMYIRRHLDETHTESSAANAGEASAPHGGAFGYVVKHHLREVVLGVLMIVGMTTAMYIVGFYMPSYSVKVLGMPKSGSFLSGCIAGLVMIVVSPFFGILTDSLKNRKRLVLVSHAGIFALILPFFWLVNQYHSLALMLPGVAILIGFLMVGGAPVFLMTLEAFPARARVTGMGLIYAICVTIFGGFAQFIVTWLLHITSNPLAPALYMMATSAISFAATLAFPSRKPQ